MRPTLFPLLFVVAFTACPPYAACAAEPDDSFKDGYLLQGRVFNGSFATFLPPNNVVGGRLHSVWEDDRLARWKTRVGRKLVEAGSVQVRPVAYDEDIPVSFDVPAEFRTMEQRNSFKWLAQTLDAEKWYGREEVRSQTDTGAKTVRTNEFQFVTDRELGRAVRWNPPKNGLPFALRVDQGVGLNLMFVSREDLEGRWKRLASDRDWRRLRAEMSHVRIVLGARFADGSAARRAWLAWLDAFLADHPQAWPKLIFQNSRPESVEVLCRIATGRTDEGGNPVFADVRRKIGPNGSWIADMPSKGPAVRKVVWSFHPDKKLCEKDYGEHDDTTWRSDALDDFTIDISAGLLPLRPPFFRLDATMLPFPWLQEDFLANRGQLAISVVYKDSKTPVELDARAWAHAENLPVEIDVEPHREISSVRLRSRDTGSLRMLETEYRPEKASVCRGETLALEGVPRLLPWPDLLLSNPTNVVVTNVVRLLSDGSEIARGEVVVPVGKQEVSVRGKFDAAANRAWDAAGVTNLAVEISPRAPSARPSTVRFDVFRGQKGPVRRAPMPDVRNLDWVNHDVRIGEIADIWTAFNDDYYLSDRERCVKDVRSNTNNVFHVLMVHLRDCGGCPECRKDDAFRRFHDQFERMSGELAWTEAMAKAKPDDPDWNAARSWESDERTFVLACMLYEYLVDPEGDGHAENLDERKRIPDGAGTPAETAIALARKGVLGLSVGRRQGGVR